MAKGLNFQHASGSFTLAPTKIERKKVYGWTELRVTDPDGGICRQAGLDGNGITIVPKGATKTGMLREDGCWMEKDELQAQHADGTVAEAVASSFDGVINLDNKVTSDALLDLIISSVYQLDGEGAEDFAKLIGGNMYAFQFSYRGGYTTSDAILMSNGTTAFILVGEKAQFEMIGLEEQGVIDEPEEEVVMEDDELDFSMF